jgi:hypothetical protein
MRRREFLWEHTFGHYSVTVFVFAPAAPVLSALPMAPGASQLVLQLRAQAGAPWVTQVSTNLTTWASVATNTPAAALVNITNTVPAGTPRQYWRVVWKP